MERKKRKKSTKPRKPRKPSKPRGPSDDFFSGIHSFTDDKKPRKPRTIKTLDRGAAVDPSVEGALYDRPSRKERKDNAVERRVRDAIYDEAQTAAGRASPRMTDAEARQIAKDALGTVIDSVRKVRGDRNKLVNELVGDAMKDAIGGGAENFRKEKKNNAAVSRTSRKLLDDAFKDSFGFDPSTRKKKPGSYKRVTDLLVKNAFKDAGIARTSLSKPRELTYDRVVEKLVRDVFRKLFDPKKVRKKVDNPIVRVEVVRIRSGKNKGKLRFRLIKLRPRKYRKRTRRRKRKTVQKPQKYIVYPTLKALRELFTVPNSRSLPPSFRLSYLQHRSQDEAWAIASRVHPNRQFLSKEEVLVSRKILPFINGESRTVYVNRYDLFLQYLDPGEPLRAEYVSKALYAFPTYVRGTYEDLAGQQQDFIYYNEFANADYQAPVNILNGSGSDEAYPVTGCRIYYGDRVSGDPEIYYNTQPHHAFSAFGGGGGFSGAEGELGSVKFSKQDFLDGPVMVLYSSYPTPGTPPASYGYILDARKIGVFGVVEYNDQYGDEFEVTVAQYQGRNGPCQLNIYGMETDTLYGSWTANKCSDFELYQSATIEPSNIWTFSRTYRGTTKQHQVIWDGKGEPTKNLTKTSKKSVGFDYETKKGKQGFVEGQPDCYTWAVWFMVNGIPTFSQWPPIDGRNPGWYAGRNWYEYPFVPDRSFLF